MTVSITFSKETSCAGDEEVLGAEELRDPNPGGVILRRLAPETVRCWERRRRWPRACTSTGRRRAARQGGITVPPRQQRRRREQQAGPAVLMAAAAASVEEDGAGEVHA